MEKKSTQQWSIKKLVGFSLFVILLTAFVIELSFRIPAYFRWSSKNTNLYIQASPRIASDSILIWNNRPFYLEFHNESQYNELGMRMPTGEVFMPKKSDEDFWVFLLGGSAMAGMGSNMNGEWLDITNVFNHPIATSIDGYLQSYLAERFPNKEVKVFNAAITSTTVLQSQWNYNRLKKYNPDWVISLDGVNEPKSLKKGSTVREYLINDWKNDPANKAPITYYTAVTRRSAFLNSVKKNLFFSRLNWRRANNQTIQKKWLNTHPLPLKYGTSDKDADNAVDSFFVTLENFRSLLIHDNQKHLLLIQPHLSLRNPRKIQELEKAVYSYYSTLDNYIPTNYYYQTVYEKARRKYPSDSSIFLMDWVHESKDWAFVDYCHFTAEMNQKIAEQIGKYIIEKEQ